jgi:hypothetical protein
MQFLKKIKAPLRYFEPQLKINTKQIFSAVILFLIEGKYYYICMY